MEWEDAYRNALPDFLRPDPADGRFLAAAWKAERNGWAPETIAEQVAQHNYRGAFNPVVIALKRLESRGHEAPRTADEPEPCTDCFEGWIDQEGPSNPNPPSYSSTRPCPRCRPELAARIAEMPHPGQRRSGGIPTVPPEFIRERVELLLELARTPDLTEEEREDCMRVLIAVQRRRPNPV